MSERERPLVRVGVSEEDAPASTSARVPRRTARPRRYHFLIDTSCTASSRLASGRDTTVDTKAGIVRGDDAALPEVQAPLQLPLRPEVQAVPQDAEMAPLSLGAMRDADQGRTAEVLAVADAMDIDGDCAEAKMLLMQFPKVLPFNKPSRDDDDKACVVLSDDEDDEDREYLPAQLCDVPPGTQVGKLLVYDDGSVRMEMGGTAVPFDISATDDVAFAEDFVDVDADEGTATFLGCVKGRAVATPVVRELLKQQAR